MLSFHPARWSGLATQRTMLPPITDLTPCVAIDNHRSGRWISPKRSRTLVGGPARFGREGKRWTVQPAGSLPCCPRPPVALSPRLRPAAQLARGHVVHGARRWQRLDEVALPKLTQGCRIGRVRGPAGRLRRRFEPARHPRGRGRRDAWGTGRRGCRWPRPPTGAGDRRGSSASLRPDRWARRRRDWPQRADEGARRGSSSGSRRARPAGSR